MICSASSVFVLRHEIHRVGNHAQQLVGGPCTGHVARRLTAGKLLVEELANLRFRAGLDTRGPFEFQADCMLDALHGVGNFGRVRAGLLRGLVALGRTQAHGEQPAAMIIAHQRISLSRVAHHSCVGSVVGPFNGRSPEGHRKRLTGRAR